MEKNHNPGSAQESEGDLSFVSAQSATSAISQSGIEHVMGDISSVSLHPDNPLLEICLPPQIYQRGALIPDVQNCLQKLMDVQETIDIEIGLVDYDGIGGKEGVEAFLRSVPQEHEGPLHLNGRTYSLFPFPKSEEKEPAAEGRVYLFLDAAVVKDEQDDERLYIALPVAFSPVASPFALRK
jgi:hypothetical protein